MIDLTKENCNGIVRSVKPRDGELRPFIPYYGSKWRIALSYPQPKYDTIIEPFAGGAGYALRYPNRNVILYDLNYEICSIWNWLINVSEEEFMSLPTEIPGKISDLNICQEAKWFIGFRVNPATTTPRNSVTSWAKAKPKWYWSEHCKEGICNQLKYIRHWKVYNKSYEQIENIESTWFIDPPYHTAAGRLYKFNLMNYNKLGEWCKERNGQVIVCEHDDADWLPFQYLGSAQSTGVLSKPKSEEVIWVGENN